jgi:hypothetical protein
MRGGARVCLGRRREHLEGVFLLNQDRLQVGQVVQERVGFLLREGSLPDVLLVPDFNAHYLLVLSDGKYLQDLKLLTLLILGSNYLEDVAVEPDVGVLRVLKLIVPPLELGECQGFLDEWPVPIHQGRLFLRLEDAVGDVKDLGGLHEVQIQDLVPRDIRGGDIHESHAVARLQALVSLLVLLKEGNVGGAVLGFKGVDHLKLENHPESGD